MTEQTYVPSGPGAPLTGADVQAMIDASLAPINTQIANILANQIQAQQALADIATLQTTVLNLANKDAAQDVSIGSNTTAIATNTTAISANATALTTINTEQGTQNSRLDAVELKNTQQDSALSSLDTRVDALEPTL
jgi:hypothetical protein